MYWLSTDNFVVIQYLSKSHITLKFMNVYRFEMDIIPFHFVHSTIHFQLINCLISIDLADSKKAEA